MLNEVDNTTSLYNGMSNDYGSTHAMQFYSAGKMNTHDGRTA